MSKLGDYRIMSIVGTVNLYTALSASERKKVEENCTAHPSSIKQGFRCFKKEGWTVSIKRSRFYFLLCSSIIHKTLISLSLVNFETANAVKKSGYSYYD